MRETVKKIISRGKNRDEFGNPYIAALVITNRRVIIIPMTSFSSGESDVIRFIKYNGLRQFPRVTFNDLNVEVEHTKVSRFQALENPHRWRVELPDLPKYFYYDPNMEVCDYAKAK